MHDPFESDPVLLKVSGVLFQRELLVVVPALQREDAVTDDILRLGAFVAMLLHTGTVRWCRGRKSHQGREIAAWPFEGALHGQLVLRLHSQL